MANEKNDALSFVTKKVLVTFSNQICLLLGESAVFTNAAICEFQQAENGHLLEIPKQFTIVGLPDGRKLAKSYVLHVNWTSVSALVELD